MIENFLRHLPDYQEPINLSSAICSLVFALTIYLLYRKSKTLHKERWILPLAHTFLLLALLYFVRILKFSLYGDAKLPESHSISIFISLCSGVTNFLLLLAAFHLARPALHEQVIQLLGKLHIGRAYTRYGALAFICLMSLLRVWTNIPDSIFSFLSLTAVGFVLYQNISLRRDRLMAWIALLSSICYAIFYLLRDLGGEPFVRYYVPGEGLEHAQLIKIIVSLLFTLPFFILKFGVFLSSYSLMLMLSAPFEGIEQLVKRLNEKKKEFLENDGIVMSIRDELHLGSVKLIIKLPGWTNKKAAVAIYACTSAGSDQLTGPRIEEYQEGTNYDRVMKEGKTYIEPRKGYPYWPIRRIAEATVPISFHQSVIACLSAERGEGKFTEADLSILERIASMIAPAVQPYREMAAINKLNQDVAQLQIEVDEYKIRRDITGITKRIHDIVAPFATELVIEAGFSKHKATYPPNGEFKKLVKKQLKARPGEEDFVDKEGNRWLTLNLKIPYKSTPDGKPREQNVGRILFLAEIEKKSDMRITVGTNPVFRRFLSDLMTDILLDFVRGYLSFLTDNLGAKLSGLKGTEFEKWHKEVQKSARKAGLLWVVAKVSDGRSEPKWLGDDELRNLVCKAESPQLKGNWQRKTKELHLYPFDEANGIPYHVIKFCKDSEISDDSKAEFWFGVGCRGFGEELSYISPWRYFLEHFCEIAHAALLRIQKLVQEEITKKGLLSMYNLSGVTIDYSDALHGLSQHTRQLKLPIQGFLTAVSKNGVQVSGDAKSWLDSVKVWLDSLEKGCLYIENSLESLSSVFDRDTKGFCSLDEVISVVCNESENSLQEYGINLEKHNLPSGAMINVPFNFALSAVSNIFNNAIDALRDERRPNTETEPAMISITVHSETKKVVCEITDNGPGVDKTVLPKLFFERAKSSKENSRGIGLLLSRIILENSFGGFISHRKPGRKGATFRIEFPRYSKPPESTLKAKPIV